MKVRPPAVAGTFYPAPTDELRNTVDQFLSKAASHPVKKWRAIIVPHAGLMYSGAVAAQAFKLLKGTGIKRVFLVGPSHYAWFEGLAEDGHAFWETPLGKIKTKRLSHFTTSDFVCSVPEAFAAEHCLEVELPFLQRTLTGFEIVPLLTGNASPQKVADLLLPLLDSSSLLVASSDLSHYHPYEEARRLDGKANKAIPSLDMERVENEVEACGKTAVLVAMHVAKKLKCKGLFLGYQNSGDTAGDKSSVVGYGAYAFFTP